jgi:hypothetical protein
MKMQRYMSCSTGREVLKNTGCATIYLYSSGTRKHSDTDTWHENRYIARNKRKNFFEGLTLMTFKAVMYWARRRR